MTIFRDRWAGAPRSKEPVITSVEVLEECRTVTLVARRSGGWLFLSGCETDDSEPVATHFSHLVDADPSLSTLRLRRGEYSLRYEAGQPWHVYGPMGDEEMTELLESGVVDSQRADIAAPFEG